MKRFLQALGLKKREKVSPHAARFTVYVRSTRDGARQPCLWIPADGEGARPLLVHLHPWRHGYDFDSSRWQDEASKRGWHFLAPHFRGPNKRPQACASREARQDVLDAVDFACAAALVDEDRIYVCGVSGGGHMTLVMAAEAPQRWAAVSAWCPVTDLAAFHGECVAMGAKAYRHIEKVARGAPGSSPLVDEELRYRSPLFYLATARNLPVEISHGIRDGQPKGIGIQHSVWAFNALARAMDAPGVSGAELDSLLAWRPGDFLPAEQDATYGRPVYLRREAGPSRLTIFDGGHEDLPGAACVWLENHARLTITRDP